MSRNRPACADLPESEKEVFFDDTAFRRAKKICDRCSVTEACLQIALDHEQPGVERHYVYGKMTASERNRKFGYRRSA